MQVQSLKVSGVFADVAFAIIIDASLFGVKSVLQPGRRDTTIEKPDPGSWLLLRLILFCVYFCVGDRGGWGMGERRGAV